MQKPERQEDLNWKDRKLRPEERTDWEREQGDGEERTSLSCEFQEVYVGLLRVKEGKT